MTRAPNTVANRRWQKFAGRIALVATTTLALACLTVGVASYFRLVVYELCDPNTRWCVFTVHDGYAMGTYADWFGPPFWIIDSPELCYKLEQIMTASENSNRALVLAQERYAKSPSQEIKRKIDELQVVTRELHQLARRYRHDVKERYWINGNMMLEPFQFKFHVHLAIPFILLAWYPLYRMARFVQHRRRLKRVGKCVQCGYDLTGNVSGVCSECGCGISERQGT